ncbi:MAG: hypothetical protein RR757_06520, partial [Raoultibacter sp.]
GIGYTELRDSTMKHNTHSSRWAQATLSLVLATTLVAGAVPAAAFADTSVKVSMAAPTQVSETVNLAGTQASGEGQPEGEAATEGTQSPTKTSNQASSNQASSNQATASVALTTGTTTVLDNGLVFVIDNATNTAAITGWYGTQPAENLTLPAQIRHNGKLAEVNILGGGGGSLHGFRF